MRFYPGSRSAEPSRRSFAQKSSSINLDSHVREGQDHFEVLPFKARLPLHSPRQFVEQLSSEAPHRAPRGQYVLGSFFSARAGPNLLSDVQNCTPRTAAVPLEPDSLHARTVFSFSQRGEHEMSEQNKAIVRRLIEEVWN